MAKTTVAVTEQTPTPVQNRTEEKTYLTANHKKEDKAVQNMTVKQRLSYLKAKQFEGNITKAEEEEKDKLEDQLNDEKAVDIKRDNSLKKEKNKDTEDIEDIFKEDDILNYMYNKWLLAGANWSFKKTYKGVAWLSDKTAEKIIYPAAGGVWKGVKDYVSPKPAPQDCTTNFVKDADKNFLNFSKANLAAADKSQDKFLNKLDRYSRGEATDAEKQTISFQVINELPPLKRIEACKKMADMYVNAANNVKAINYMAAALTRAQMIQNTLGNEKPAPFDPTAFATYTKRNAVLIAQQLDGSNDPIKTMDDLYKDIERANKRVNKSLDKGKYKETSTKHKSKNPRANAALERLNTRLGLDAQGKNQQTPQQQNTGSTVFQTLVTYQNLDNVLTMEEEKERQINMDTKNFGPRSSVLNQKESVNSSENHNYQARKAAFMRFVNSMNIPNSPEHWRKKASNSNDSTPNPLTHSNGGDGR